MRRSYTPVEQAQAVALATTLGQVKAAEQLAIPRTTLARWMHTPAQSEVIAAAEHDIAATLRVVHAEALAKLRARINDPKARLGELAQAVRVLGEQSALADGRATSNLAVSHQTRLVDDMNDDERFALKRALDVELARRQAMADVLTPEEMEELDAMVAAGEERDLIGLLELIKGKLVEEGVA